mmetsp:Transcript_11262/g.42039  ORF Transcript_11262/g.42039 Transcript_11262/m.42039 type:complete len:202 (-) Transcript_11262:360-965(-)
MGCGWKRLRRVALRAATLSELWFAIRGAPSGAPSTIRWCAQRWDTCSRKAWRPSASTSEELAGPLDPRLGRRRQSSSMSMRRATTCARTARRRFCSLATRTAPWWPVRRRTRDPMSLAWSLCRIRTECFGPLPPSAVLQGGVPLQERGLPSWFSRGMPTTSPACPATRGFRRSYGRRANGLPTSTGGAKMKKDHRLRASIL